MPTQLLIYESVVPLSAARHRDCSVEIGGSYDFSGKVNSVPLMAVEFPPATTEYAIVFAGNDGNLMPAVILGVRGSENVYLSKENVWEAKYIPAFVRRYPFVFSTSPDGKQLILCIDEAFAGFNREGRGQPLFGGDGKPSPYVENVLKFLQEFQAQYLRTQTFCGRLRDLDILEPMQAQVELASGERLALGGFMAVSRAKLKAVPADKLAELAQTDELELLYLHLQSMRNFLGLRDRLAVVEGGRLAAQSAADAEAGTGEVAAGEENATADGDGNGATAPSGGKRSGRAAAE
ncbi:MAG TPA: SapC family protein [Stellaceae bacterium]|nr:SapC family protein [Stellaceae bacterium]